MSLFERIKNVVKSNLNDLDALGTRGEDPAPGGFFDKLRDEADELRDFFNERTAKPDPKEKEAQDAAAEHLGNASKPTPEANGYDQELDSEKAD